jgi:hypothetical protein
MSFVIFWVVTLCDLIAGYKCFEGTYHLHFQGDMLHNVLSPCECHDNALK